MTYLMLFGIKYADLLHRENITDILMAAGVATLGPTVNMGRRLARHVTLKTTIGPPEGLREGFASRGVKVMALKYRGDQPPTVPSWWEGERPDGSPSSADTMPMRR